MSATEICAWDAPLWLPVESACSTRESTNGSSTGRKQLPTASVMLGRSRALCKELAMACSCMGACT